MSATLIYVLAVALAVFGVAVYARKDKKVVGVGKGLLGTIFVLAAVFLVVGQMGYLPANAGGQFFAVAGTAGTAGQAAQNPNNPATAGQVGYQPTAVYSATDAYSNNAISGTSYYKVNNAAAKTTAYSNVNIGDDITYWVSNSTVYVKPLEQIAGAGVNTFATTGWTNGTVTITGYDPVNHAATTTGAYNTSLGANAQANEQFTYQGTAKKSAAPFGGVMIVEQNSTISSVTCTGADLLSTNPYHVTYTVQATTNAYEAFAFASTLDDGSGSAKTISCQFQNGATAVGAGSAYYVKFVPANYYVTNDGRILLDTEKNANQDTTRTGLNSPSQTFYWNS